jgi:hypothetical protein
MPDASPIDLLPPPRVIHARIGKLYRELSLLRRLLRLAQRAEAEMTGSIANGASTRGSRNGA